MNITGKKLLGILQGLEKTKPGVLEHDIALYDQARDEVYSNFKCVEIVADDHDMTDLIDAHTILFIFNAL